MTEDGFLVIETDFKPKPVAKPEPVISAQPGRTIADLSPTQMARTVRSQIGPFFVEPIYAISGPTGRWKVGREIGSVEQTIAEFDNRADAMECFRRQVAKFHGSG